MHPNLAEIYYKRLSFISTACFAGAFGLLVYQYVKSREAKDVENVKSADELDKLLKSSESNPIKLSFDSGIPSPREDYNRFLAMLSEREKLLERLKSEEKN